ncbi:MAG: tRNA (adenosine(37)-N6)-threonylcarbamoyltransferase complex transferase subunit TsaD, partial [Alphaproteobacteria bacterium]|nr:tRNA (adenosine(37)-N6)-threonylcarbamoyltransferase complex transferase subunit TsaD [Alphaproteobacteria bacterium]
MYILGIETSCDETSVAIVDGDGEIRVNLLYSQIEDHVSYGGVVPEIAARAHLEKLAPLVDLAFEKSGLAPKDITAIAATCGPGLIGGVVVGAMYAKGLAAALNKPFIAINHLEGHALTIRLTDKVAFPFLLLLASGGHCQFIEAHSLGHYTLLGETIDDAAGEAFDKVASMLGLP